jgi:putative flippase GtrA
MRPHCIRCPLEARLEVGAGLSRLPTMGVIPRGVPLLRRIRAGMNRSGNWWQLIRFCLVGGSCYLVNVGTFAVVVELVGVHYIAGAVIAYAVAITCSFFGHRIVTFRARYDRAHSQAWRFLWVYVPATLIGTGLLHLGVVAGLPEVGAQALVAGLVAPLTFTANKMWSFAPVWRPAEASDAPRP